MRDPFLCFVFADWYRGYLIKHKMLQVRLIFFIWGNTRYLFRALPPLWAIIFHCCSSADWFYFFLVSSAARPLHLRSLWASTPFPFHLFLKANLLSSLLPETFPDCQSNLISPFLESPWNCAFSIQNLSSLAFL